MFDLIVAAAGLSTRFCGKKNKLLYNVNGRTVFENSILPFLSFDELDKIIVATSSDIYNEILTLSKNISNKIIVVKGGATRTESVKNALTCVTSENVLIHDGARPYVTPKIIQNVLDGLKKYGASIPVIKLNDSICDISKEYTPLNREDMRFVQTPQGFNAKKIKQAYEKTDNVSYTDDASVYLKSYCDIVAVEGDICNKKITSYNDLALPLCRAGVGYDTHVLTKNRKLILGGVTIPYYLGLSGHSDADVLAHAIMDALLSSCGLKDIGFYFPDSDKKYENANSLNLLKEVAKIIKNEGYVPHNIAATILCQNPKLSPFVNEMIINISTALNMDKSMVGISCTTTENVGDIGQGLAISTIATATVIKQ